MLISVKAARVNAKLTQEQVADKLGLSLNGYKRKENGERRFYVDEIVQLGVIFGVKIEDFYEVWCLKKTHIQADTLKKGDANGNFNQCGA